MLNLDDLGFGPADRDAFSALNDPNLVPARVAVVHRGGVEVVGAPFHGVLSLASRLGGPDGPLGGPAVGDFVAISTLDGRVVTDVLPRRSVFVRRAAGRDARPQVVAANLDCVLVVTAPDGDLSARRIDRYLAAIFDGGAEPVVVVNKADLGADAALQELRDGAPGVPVVAISAHTGEGLDALRARLTPGTTVALVGSSGVGKSTLLNRLLGEERVRTGAVRESDGKGRHTTTRRELYLTPAGVVVIDTPGMREIGLWDAEAGIDRTFPEVSALTHDCRFNDCKHEGEPGCAVLQALSDGRLTADRVAGYLRLQREVAQEQERADPRQARKRGRAGSRALRAFNKLTREPTR